MTLYVYALVPPTRSRHAIRGIAGERISRITIGAITALIGEVRRAPRPTAGNLRRYASVIAGIAAHAPAVLPARFGTCLSDLEELTLVLRSRQDPLRRRLRLVRGRVQMTLRIVLGSPPRPVSGTTPSGEAPASRGGVESRASPGTRYLLRRAADAARMDDIPEFATIRESVRRFVRDERIERRGGVATVNHLIPRAGVRAYSAAIARATARVPVRVVLSGPWAPFAFAEVGD